MIIHDFDRSHITKTIRLSQRPSRDRCMFVM